MPRAVVLVSGGLDSCVAATIAAADHDLCFLHLNYRQRTQERELQAFNAIADHYRVNHRLVVDAGYMRDIGGSSLTDPHLPIPQEHGDDVPSTYVPFRNANKEGVGVAWAEAIDADALFIWRPPDRRALSRLRRPILCRLSAHHRRRNQTANPHPPAHPAHRPRQNGHRPPRPALARPAAFDLIVLPKRNQRLWALPQLRAAPPGLCPSRRCRPRTLTSPTWPTSRLRTSSPTCPLVLE